MKAETEQIPATVRFEYAKRYDPGVLSWLFIVVWVIALTIAVITFDGTVEVKGKVYTGWRAITWVTVCVLTTIFLVVVSAFTTRANRLGTRYIVFLEDMIKLPKSAVSIKTLSIHLANVQHVLIEPQQHKRLIQIRHAGGTTKLGYRSLANADQFDELCDEFKKRTKVEMSESLW